MVSCLSIFCNENLYLLVSLVILGYLVRSAFSTPALVVHSCLLGFRVLIWSSVDSTGVWSVLSLSFFRGFMVRIFHSVPLSLLFNFHWAEVIFLLLSWFSSSASSLKKYLKGCSNFKLPSNFPVIYLVTLCIPGLPGCTCFFQLDIVQVFSCSKSWSPFPSCSGVTVSSHGSCKEESIFKNQHVQEVLITWDCFKICAHIKFYFPLLRDIYCMRFDSIFPGLNLAQKIIFILRNFYDTRWCFLIPFCAWCVVDSSRFITEFCLKTRQTKRKLCWLEKIFRLPKPFFVCVMFLVLVRENPSLLSLIFWWL